MDNRTAKIINCLSNRVKKLESQNSDETRLNLKDFTNKEFDENKIEEALNELRVYFKKQNRLLCLIGNDETLLSDTNFNHLFSEVTSVEGNLKHYSKEDNVINNHYSDLDEDMKKNIDMVNQLNILLEVGNKMTPHVVGSLSLLDARYLEEIGYGLKLFSGNSYVMAYGGYNFTKEACNYYQDYNRYPPWRCQELLQSPSNSNDPSNSLNSILLGGGRMPEADTPDEMPAFDAAFDGMETIKDPETSE